ncbi:MAG: peptide-methionine (S)-S-oxide reductase [Desulfuromusa sp.]|nr:peptide-methionine (S)-S-oxide reductase [Desulfuromusa sp.]
MLGVYRTSAGYAGGSGNSPSYRRMKDHSETVLVEFNPQEVSYLQLLEVFWGSHDPTIDSYSRQYRNAIFYVTEEQRIQAEQSRELLEDTNKLSISTMIEKAGDFYPAEDYHQKYYLRRLDKLIGEFKQIYPDDAQFVASTAAARINGYLGCNGNPEDLKKEVDLFGLSLAAQKYLVAHVSTKCSRFEGMTCPAPQRE